MPKPLSLSVSFSVSGSVSCVILSSVLLSFCLSGCASYFKRKECEKTNWFQHGHDVAMAGKRLDADDFTKQCQKVEANMSFTDMDTGFKAGMARYCSPDNVFLVGKSGKRFSYDMCDGESLRKMRARYDEGIKIFCSKENAYPFGAGGGVYLDVCPKNQESAWLPEYRRGRKAYLQMMLEENTRSVSQLESRASDLELQKLMLTSQRSSIQARTVVQEETVVDPVTHLIQRQTKIVADPNAQHEADQISSQIYEVDEKISSARSEQDKLNQEIVKIRTEMLSL